MIGRSGERGSGISVLAARHDDDDDPSNKKKLRNSNVSLPIKRMRGQKFS